MQWRLTRIRYKRCHLPDGDRGPTLFHHGMLPGPGQRLIHRAHHRCHIPGPPIGVYHGGWGPKNQRCRAGREHAGHSDRGGPIRHGTEGNVRPLYPATNPMITGWLDMEHDQTGEGGTVPYGVNSWYRPPYVPERLCPIPQTQHRQLHGYKVSPHFWTEVAPGLPQAVHVDPYPPPQDNNAEGCYV